MRIRQETKTRILEAFYRLFRELKCKPEDLSHPAPILFLHALCMAKFPDFGKRFPGSEDPVIFASLAERILSPGGIEAFVAEQDEPDPYWLDDSLRQLSTWSGGIKRVSGAFGKQIQPTGGPPEKLTDLPKIGSLTDELFRRLSDGESKMEILADLEKRERFSLSTINRRIDEELERRRTVRMIKGNDGKEPPVDTKMK
jgi:hypothetical protein